MKWLRVGLTAILLAIIASPSALALEAQQYDPPVDLEKSPVIVVGYQLESGLPGYVQLYNDSKIPVNIQGWRVEYVVGSQLTPIVLADLDGWIAPSNYILVANDTVRDADYIFGIDGEVSDPQMLRIKADGFAPHEVAVKSDGYYSRKVSASTGSYLTTFEKIVRPGLYSGGFYDFPEQTPLRFTEILAHPKSCSPLNEALECGDYVKLYNPSNTIVDLSGLRLRVGYKGQAPTSSNTYQLTGEILPGHYTSIVVDEDGENVSITNSGGFVWLEDTYGIKLYESTVQGYEDASASSKVGWAWAYDEQKQRWRWTSEPTPGDGPSIFPTIVEKTTNHTSSSLVPCRVGQYRSVETNRCRNVTSATSSTSLKPCTAGQIRNPETNRCRKIASSASSSLTPCAKGQERNPETNRCRKVASDSSVPAAAFAVEPITEGGKAFMGWWAVGGITAIGIGYGLWEWREEAGRIFRKVGNFFTSSR